MNFHFVGLFGMLKEYIYKSLNDIKLRSPPNTIIDSPTTITE